jgi:hypothetical protein
MEYFLVAIIIGLSGALGMSMYLVHMYKRIVTEQEKTFKHSEVFFNTLLNTIVDNEHIDIKKYIEQTQLQISISKGGDKND